MGLLIGLLAAAFTFAFWARQPQGSVSDWDAIWTAASALSQGRNPYAAIVTPPWPWRLFYPLPAVVLVMPFSLASLELARPLFMGLSSALFAYALTRRAWWPLLALWSGAMVESLRGIQWAPLLMTATLIPALGFVYAAKPTTGLALWLAAPSRRPVIGGLVLLAVSFVLSPSWVRDWLDSLGGIPHLPPVLRPGGLLVLLAVLRWRRADARLLVALACMPQTTTMYEVMPLFLLARSWKEAGALSALTMAAVLLYRYTPQGPWPTGADEKWLILLAIVYLPALAAVLARPNVRSGLGLGIDALPPVPVESAQALSAASG
jgi:hypothetical protein